MTLKFITGAGNINHQAAMIQTALEWLKEPDYEVFFLVPNYNKFERELEILSSLKQAIGKTHFSTIRSQVYSFHRLAWYFLQRTGQLGKQPITEAGALLLMRKVLIKCEPELLLYRSEIGQSGFIMQLLDLYQEFQLGNIDFEQLVIPEGDTAIEVTNRERNFQMKLRELQIIFNAYESELHARELQVEQPLPLLTNYLNHLAEDSLKKTLFIVSGFSNFSAQEHGLLQSLMSKSNLCIDLLIDTPHEQTEVLDLFFDGKETYQHLKSAAQAQQIPVYFDQKGEKLTEVTPSYHVLEAYWRNSHVQNQTIEHSVDDFLEIWQAQTPIEELRQIAVEIKRLMVQSHKTNRPLAYRDIQLVTLNPKVYYPLIPVIFKEMGLPYYLDETKQMDQHPLIEFIDSLLALPKYHYRLKDIFRFLRSELYIPKDWDDAEQSWEQNRNRFRNQVDLTENVALAHQFQGQTWLKKEDWQLIAYDFEASQLEDTRLLTETTNQVRRSFARDIGTFFATFKNQETIKDAVICFYQFLIEMGIEQQLIYWRNQEIERGQLESARNHEQTWDALMEILDQFVEIYGEERFEFQLFTEMLMSGLANLQFGKIPTAIDQIKINPLDLARPLQSKVTFAIGLDEGSFPRKVENATLLSSDERLFLNTYLTEEQYIRDHTQETIRKEPFVAYNVFLSASHKLYLSYAINHDEQQNIQASPYLKRLIQWAGLKEQKRQSLKLESTLTQHIGSYRGLVRQLNNLHRQSQDAHVELSKSWRILQEALLQSDYHTLAKKVLASQAKKNIPQNMSSEVAKDLYGKDIYTSVSRMETFYQCEYKYFVNFGLRLKERDIYGLNPLVTGELFHEALDRFLSLVIQQNQDLTQLSEAEKRAFVDQVLQEIFGLKQYHLLDASPRMHFIRHQLAKTIQRVTWAIHQQSGKSLLQPRKTEVLFGQVGQNKGIQGLTLPLGADSHLYVRGKIDRIDTAEMEENLWLSVVDYKSSSRKFDLTEAYFGLAMQLITYLDVALTNAIQTSEPTKQVKPAGAYYFHVHNPLLDPSKGTEEERLKAYQFDGLFVDDEELFPIYDQSLEPSTGSLVFPIKKNKDDIASKRTKNDARFYSEEEITLLRKHNQEKLMQGGQRILSGEISLNPYYKVKDKKRACQYCPFRTVCNFDVMLAENQYRRMDNLKKEEIIKKMGGDDE